MELSIVRGSVKSAGAEFLIYASSLCTRMQCSSRRGRVAVGRLGSVIRLFVNVTTWSSRMVVERYSNRAGRLSEVAVKVLFVIDIGSRY